MKKLLKLIGIVFVSLMTMAVGDCSKSTSISGGGDVTVTDVRIIATDNGTNASNDINDSSDNSTVDNSDNSSNASRTEI